MAIDPPIVPTSRHSLAVERLRRSVLGGPGQTHPDLRRQVAAYANELWRAGKTDLPLPDELRPYLDKVTLAAYKVTDEDVENLRNGGFSDDEILELTLACAVGCGLGTLGAGLAVVGEA